MASLSFGDNGLNNVTDLASTTLDGDITGSPATFTVGDGSRFPSANFTVLIDSEQIFISSRTSETLTVGARGAGSPATSSVDHSSGATVALVLASEHIQAVADWLQPVSDVLFESGGNLGIGAASPDGKLEIFTGTSGTSGLVSGMPTGSIGFGNASVSNTIPSVSGRSDNNTGLQIMSGTVDGNASPDMILSARENDNTDFATLAGKTAFSLRRFSTSLLDITRDGNVGIGTTSPDGSGITVDTALHVAESSGSSAVNVDSTTDSRIIFSESDVWKYNISYSATNNRFVISSTDTDGGGTDADVIRIADGEQRVDFVGANIALGGGAAPTLGTIGGSGPATAAQNEWMVVRVNGNTRFIPVWA